MAISRCDSAGHYRVVFEEQGLVDGHPVSVGQMRLQLGQHEWSLDTRDGSPIISTEEPFEGELCPHEVRFLQGFPGKKYNYKWRFLVTPLSTNGRKKGH